jgi:hypothetical protein
MCGSTTAALPAGYRRLPVPRDLLPAVLPLLKAIVVAAPQRQGLAIAEPQRLETDRALPLKDVGTARRERDAAPPRARPRLRGSDFSGSDFRFLIVRHRVALAEEPPPAARGCATRARRRARGCLVPRHSCWGRVRQPVDHAALPRTYAGRFAKGLRVRLPSSRADPAQAALPAHLLGLHCAVDPMRHPS